MHTKISIPFFKKLFKYVAAMLILLFAVVPSEANYIHRCYKVSPGTGIHRSELERRMLLVAVIDSDDKDIGKRCETDLDEMTYAFEELADWLEITWEEPKIIKGDEFDKEAVNDAIDNWLQNQQPGRDDIVIFYYSGHGFRFPNDIDDYPRMWLKTSQDQNVETTNLKMQDIYNRIVKLGAGINLVISDCCNTTAAGESGNFDNVAVPVRKRVEHKKNEAGNDGEQEDEMDNGDKLFNPNRPFSVLVTAAQKNEFAGGKPDVGGFFTYYLVEALTKCVYDEDIEPDWQNIFKYADENASYWARSAACPDAKHTPQGRCIQTVIFKIDEPGN